MAGLGIRDLYSPWCAKFSEETRNDRHSCKSLEAFRRASNHYG